MFAALGGSKLFEGLHGVTIRASKTLFRTRNMRIRGSIALRE